MSYCEEMKGKIKNNEGIHSEGEVTDCVNKIKGLARRKLVQLLAVR